MKVEPCFVLITTEISSLDQMALFQDPLFAAGVLVDSPNHNTFTIYFTDKARK